MKTEVLDRYNALTPEQRECVRLMELEVENITAFDWNFDFEKDGMPVSNIDIEFCKGNFCVTPSLMAKIASCRGFLSGEMDEDRYRIVMTFTYRGDEWLKRCPTDAPSGIDLNHYSLDFTREDFSSDQEFFDAFLAGASKNRLEWAKEKMEILKNFNNSKEN